MSSGTTAMVEIDVEGELQKIISQLNSLPDQLKAPDVLAKAINASANEMKRKMGKKARKRYAVTDNQVLTDKSQGAMYLERANGETPSAALISKGPMQEVMAYMTRKNKGNAAAMLKVLNESSMTALEVDGRKAFEITFKSGHVAIVQRHPPEEYSTGRAERAGKYGKKADMTKIKKLLAPAVPFLYGKTYDEAELDYYTILQKHIQRQVKRVLEQ